MESLRHAFSFAIELDDNDAAGSWSESEATDHHPPSSGATRFRAAQAAQGRRRPVRQLKNKNAASQREAALLFDRDT
ncbi:hypothetical protein CQ13_14855 [Bradyrhizobium retamae]|uniref:Uncharacterized protein n=1 Tax=Bradyrhizobium retamae TaxID=1300035 RepID=A0A0R3NHL3_9BRAD|nr:hypothetical protein CQ13_14855 [Bradyrhizobium retamae]